MNHGKVIWLTRHDFKLSDADISKDEYEDIWDNGEDDGIDYSELDGYEFEELEEVDEETEARWDAVAKLDGTIEYGECLYCGKENGMHFHKGFFFCKTCHDFVPAEVYYQWYSGFDVYLER